MHTTEPMSAPVIQIDQLTRRFGSTLALDAVSLTIPRGTVFGLLGANGAGKTTLIKHLLGLLKAQSGTVQVFGKNPVNKPQEVLARIGYLSEENDLPEWMRVDELLQYTRAFYPSWDQAFAERLCQEFQLDTSKRVKHLSKGQRARAGLVVALAYRPELLVFDEPSSGLDPIVRRDILGAIIRTVAEEGRTVVFSSHLLNEVERVADSVAIIHRGQIVYSNALDQLKQEHRCLTLRYEHVQTSPPVLDGALRCEGTEHEWTVLCRGGTEELHATIRATGARIVEERIPTLDEIFVAQVGSH